MEAWDSVHFRAQYYVQSGHMMNPALQKEIPPVGSVVAYEYAQRRRPTDTLPGYVAVNMTSPQVGSMLWWCLLTGGISLLRGKFTPGWLLWMNRISGGIITIFGLLALFYR